MTDDLPAKLKGLPGDADLGPQLQGLPGDVDLAGTLAGLTGGAGGPGVIDPGSVGDALGALLGGDGKG